MAYYPGLEDEDELDGPMPVETVAGPQTTSQKVMQRIASVRQSSGDDDEAGLPNSQDREAAIQFAKNSALTAGLGRAANAFAAGTGFKSDNSGYDAMEKQGNDFAMKEMDRSAAVRKAIEQRKGREAALAAMGLQKDRAQSETERYHRNMEEIARRNADAGREERAGRISDKKEEKELQLAVPGYERTGEVLPKTEEAQKFREATAEANNLKKSLGRLKELVKKNGSFEMGGVDGQEMQSLVRDIQLQAKGPAMYQLGVLAGPDMKILEQITADPSSLGSMFTRDATRQSQIDTQMKSLGNRIDSKAKSLGYREQALPQRDEVPSSQSGSAPTNKMVGGKKYKKVPGGWEEVE